MRIDIEEERLIIISDLHVGNPYSLATRKLATFVDYLIDGRYNLCINGDGVDILQGRLRGLTEQTVDILDLWRKYESAGGHTYYIVGNHDMALERALNTFLADYVTPFLNVTSGKLRIRVEHGHVYDPFYAANPHMYEMLGAAAAPLLRIYPDIYKVWSGTARVRQRAAKWIRKTSEEYDTPEQEAAGMLANRGFDVVVFGHTHRPERVELSHGAVYLNSGNWLRNSTFVQIADDSASLMRWETTEAVPY